MTADHEFALEWIRKAEHDLESALLLITRENLYDSVCFHCQQLAEKSIKALMTNHAIRFKKIHDLDLLLDLLNDSDFNSYRSYALILNSYTVETRYPGEYCEPEQADAEEALRVASEMFELAKRKLGVQTG